MFTTDLDKCKGIVFNFDKNDKMDCPFSTSSQPKLMASAISSGHSLLSSTTDVFCRLSIPSSQSSMDQSSSFPIFFSAGDSESKDKGKRKPCTFKRIYSSRKKAQKAQISLEVHDKSEGTVSKKRKAEVELVGASKAAKSNASKMVPREGPSNS